MHITIKKQTIGTQRVNSVNARELHKVLEIKKDFSNWIKTQVKTLGLEENVDFITYTQKGVGGKFDSIDYILTSISAKHISMASRVKKGKEVRDYFIAIEEEYQRSTNPNRIRGYQGVIAKLQKRIEQQKEIIEALESNFEQIGTNAQDNFSETVQENITLLYRVFTEQSQEFKKVADYNYVAHKRANDFINAFENFIIRNGGKA